MRCCSRRWTGCLWLTALAYLIVLLGAVALQAIASDHESSLDASFVTRLRERKLFELAERYCVDRINGSQIAEVDRADLSVELIRTLAMHAAHVPRAERATFWQAAQAAAVDFERRWPGNPRLVLVRIQSALTPLAQGELAWREHEAALLPGEEVEAARQALAQAAQSLAEIDKALAREIAARRRAPAAGGLSADELLMLQQQVQYHAARARRMRGLLYPPASDDRLAQVVAARQLLEPLRTQIAADDLQSALVRLELARCLRLAARLDDAAEALSGLDAEDGEPGVRLEARAEAIRLAITSRNVAELRLLLELGDKVGGVASAELDLARLEGWLVVSKWAEASQTASQIDARHSEYWSRRVARLLAESLASSARLDDQELLSRRADGLVLIGQLEAARTDLDRAAELARAAGEEARSFEFAYQAALIEQRLKHQDEMVLRLRALAKAMPQHPQAAEVHLLAAFHGKSLPEEEAILREHLSKWPSNHTAGQAHLWLAQLAESSGKWQDALDHYASVSGSSPAYGQASSRLAELAREHPDSGPVQEALAASLLQSSDKPVLQSALTRWQDISTRSQADSPRWLKAHYSTAAAHLALNDKASARKLLREILDQPGGITDKGWREKYAALLKRANE